MFHRPFAGRALAGAALGLVALLLASAGCVPPQVHERVVPEFEGPASIPGFARVRTIEFPASSDGWLYSYQGAGMRPDVYIYPAAATGPGMGEARLTRLESTALRKSLPSRMRHGWFGSYQVQRDEPVVFDIGGRRIEGHRLVALIRYPDEDVVTHQYLFMWGPNYVKIRETHPKGTVEAAEVERFARALIATLASSATSAGVMVSAPAP